MNIKCFWIEHIKRSRYHLRRFCWSDTSKCGGNGYHNADGQVIGESDDDPSKDYLCTNPPETPDRLDPRWPTKCDHCEYRFTDQDQFQVFGEPLYKRADTGEIKPLPEMPAGAMWNQPWYEHFYSAGPDGLWLMVKTPGGDWGVDGRANNCTRPDDTTHKCWVRSGTVPNVTAGKAGNTCAAGAGSILIGRYHGFLRNGELTDC